MATCGAKSSCSSAMHSLPPPCPRSPPEYPDLYGKRRAMAKVQILEREIGFLEEELKSGEGLQPASRCCKAITDFVVTNSDPLIPTNRKNRRTFRFWKWLCGVTCFNLSWICCCCHWGCTLQLEMPRCCDCNPCDSNPCDCCNLCDCCSSCVGCLAPKWQCCAGSCPTSQCCRGIKCSRSCCCNFKFPSCPDCSYCRWTCSCPKCPKLRPCCRCTKTCCNPCSLFF